MKYGRGGYITGAKYGHDGCSTGSKYARGEYRTGAKHGATQDRNMDVVDEALETTVGAFEQEDHRDAQQFDIVMVESVLDLPTNLYRESLQRMHIVSTAWVQNMSVVGTTHVQLVSI